MLRVLLLQLGLWIEHPGVGDPGRMTTQAILEGEPRELRMWSLVFGSLGGNCASGSDNCGVNGASMKEEGAEDFLDVLDVVGSEREGGGIVVWGALRLGTVPGIARGGGRAGSARFRMVETLEGAFNAARDGRVAGALEGSQRQVQDRSIAWRPNQRWQGREAAARPGGAGHLPWQRL